MNDKNFFIYFVIFFFVIYIVYKIEEHFRNNFYIKKEFVSCKNCNVWNDRDARSEFDYLCKKKFPQSVTEFTGKWKREGEKVHGECAFKVRKNKSLLPARDLNILSNDDAKQACPQFCVNEIEKDRYKLNGKYTGFWNRFNFYQPSCECEYEEIV